MIKLKFHGFLPIEEKPANFEKFREIASEVYSKLEGELEFYYVDKYQQFDIKVNTTNKSNEELRNMLGDKKYLMI